MTEDSPTLRDCDISDSGSGTEDEEDIYELQEVSRHRGDRFWRSYADVVTSRSERAARTESATDPAEHLGGMHRIISRLSQRDDIPESWWQSAGLSRREPSS